MGRPLKIAKAHAVLTITATDGTTEEVTVSQDISAYPTGLGILRGMPFVVASNVGNLVAGTTYWVLNVTGANTFTVSATHPSANPTNTPFNLATAGPVSVAASVAFVDAYFNNPTSGVGYPTTNTATYSVVGGNTAIYGKQVLCRAAIGVAGQGTLVVSNTSSILNVVDSSVDVSSYVSVGDWIGLNDTTPVGVIIGNSGLVTQNTVSSDALSGEITLDDSDTLIIEGAIVFGADIGGLTAGTVYYVDSKPSSTTITVSATPGGAALTLTDDTVATTATQNCLTLGADSLVTATTSTWVYASNEAAFIVRQKGKQKYLVKGVTTGLIGPCFTANVANADLSANTMNILGTYANAATVFVQSLSDHTAELFTATSGPVATGNIVVANADPAFSTFNAAAAANVANGQPYPIVTISNT